MVNWSKKAVDIQILVGGLEHFYGLFSISLIWDIFHPSKIDFNSIILNNMVKMNHQPDMFDLGDDRDDHDFFTMKTTITRPGEQPQFAMERSTIF